MMEKNKAGVEGREVWWGGRFSVLSMEVREVSLIKRPLRRDLQERRSHADIRGKSHQGGEKSKRQSP